mmetsp:Transcript_19940/g.79503  ORF Transcript_19940/g.79503 Transcript_19940/m.79503 type:complete len:205 (-) Transcript_19940:93-707(-)
MSPCIHPDDLLIHCDPRSCPLPVCSPPVAINRSKQGSCARRPPPRGEGASEGFTQPSGPSVASGANHSRHSIRAVDYRQSLNFLPWYAADRAERSAMAPAGDASPVRAARRPMPPASTVDAASPTPWPSKSYPLSMRTPEPSIAVELPRPPRSDGIEPRRVYAAIAPRPRTAANVNDAWADPPIAISGRRTVSRRRGSFSRTQG